MQSQSGDSVEFLEHLKVDLFPDEVYVFTPKGKILSLPRGATAVDFAYAVHTDIGNRCVAVKINQELMPLRTELKNGDRVEIITAAHAKPNPLWLNFVATGKARRGLEAALETVQLKNLFDATRTADETASKPDPRMLLELMKECGTTPERTLMIGDTTHDLQLALNAGTPCIGVGYGAHDHEAFAEFKPLFVAHSTRELHDWLLRHG